MVTMKRILLPMVLCSAIISSAQTFTNGEMAGSVGFVSNPTSWLSVPFTDPICYANTAAEATVDILDATGPNAAGGVAGVPAVGATFCSGLYATDGGSFFWHEGIMQTVTGFVVGNTYTISFKQAVVKQQNCIDESGSWQVYVESTLAGTASVTTSTLAYDDVNIQWECRSVTFTATNFVQNIKFIPWDDDANYLTDPGDNTGALRMGIDDIMFVSSSDPTINPSGPYCLNEPPVNLIAVTPGGTWSGTGITDPVNGTFDPAVAASGNHIISYDLVAGCGTVNDTVIITVIKPPVAAVSAVGALPCDSLCVQFNDLSLATVGNLNGWLWDFGDGGSSTDQSPYYCYADTGQYNITLIVYTDVGCSDTVNLPNEVLLSYCPTAITANDFGIALSYFPNPTSGDVIIDLGEDFSEVEVCVYTVAGDMVLNQTRNNTRTLELAINSPAGIYFIHVNTGSRNAVIRVVKE